MSNEAAELLQAGALAHEEIVGSPTFLYRGLNWPCHASALLRGNQLEIGGRVESIEMTLFIRKNAMPTRTVDANEGPTADNEDHTADEDLMPPHPGKTLVFQQRLYRIIRVDEDSAGAAWKCHLGSPNR